MVMLSLIPSHSFSIHPTSTSISGPIPPTSPFTLGCSLSHILSILTLPNVRALFPRYANTTIKYSESDPVSDPIVLTLPLGIHQASSQAADSLESQDKHSQPEVVGDTSALHLIFDGGTQRVQMIVLSGLQESNVEINYPERGQLIHSRSSAPSRLTRAGLHRYLGPTYPGVSRSKVNGYKGGSGSRGEELLLSYPGVAFGFDLGPMNGDKDAKHKAQTDVDNSQQVSSIYIFRGSTPQSAIQVSCPSLSTQKLYSSGEASSSSSWGKRASSLGSANAQNHSRNYSLSYSPSSASKSAGKIRGASETSGGDDALMAHINELERGAIGMGSISRAIVKPGRSVVLVIHSDRSSSPNSHNETMVELNLHQTTPQDVICEIGAPQSIHWREDDRLSIHAYIGQGSSCSDGRPPRDPRGAVFYNYFALGFDLMFSGARSQTGPSYGDQERDQNPEDDFEDDDEESTLMKIILHGNVPGSALFGRYGRCCWELASEREEKIGFDSKFEALKNLCTNQSSSFSSPSTNPSQSHLSPNSASPSYSRPSSASSQDLRSSLTSSKAKQSLNKSSVNTSNVEGDSRGRKSESSFASTLQVDRASSPSGSLRGLLSFSSAEAKVSEGSEGSDFRGQGIDVRTTLHGLDGLVVEEDKHGWIVGVTVV